MSKAQCLSCLANVSLLFFCLFFFLARYNRAKKFCRGQAGLTRRRLAAQRGTENKRCAACAAPRRGDATRIIFCKYKSGEIKARSRAQCIHNARDISPRRGHRYFKIRYFSFFFLPFSFFPPRFLSPSPSRPFNLPLVCAI